MRHIEYAIGFERQNILDSIGGLYTHGRDATKLSGIPADLACAVHITTHKFQLGVFDHPAHGARSDIAGGPLPHSIFPGRRFVLLGHRDILSDCWSAILS